MTRIILFVSVIFSGSFLFSQDIEGKLKELKDVTFEKEKVCSSNSNQQ